MGVQITLWIALALGLVGIIVTGVVAIAFVAIHIYSVRENESMASDYIFHMEDQNGTW